MIRSIPLPTQVYDQLFPYPQRGVDPASWQDHVDKNLVPEMRLEVHQFYGSDARTAEGKYPGMDYNSSYHRMRLRRYTHHRRLFRALDALGLTDWEIYMLCNWEGTLLVKGRYEQQQGIVLRDTTGDEVAMASSYSAEARRTILNEIAAGDIEDDDYAKEEEIEEAEDSAPIGQADEAEEDEASAAHISTGNHLAATHSGRPHAVQSINASQLQSTRLGMLSRSRGSTPARAAA